MELCKILNELSIKDFEHSRPLFSKKIVKMELESCENGGKTSVTLKVDTIYGFPSKDRERIRFSGEILREEERENPFFNRATGWYNFSQKNGSLERKRVDFRSWMILLEKAERAQTEHLKKVLGAST